MPFFLNCIFSQSVFKQDGSKENFPKNRPFKMKKLKKMKKNKGMTYVELIVVLGIFSVISSVALFNYGTFQAKVDIKNLASDIALKIVEAQKSSIAGKWNASASPDWKPSYGIHLDLSNDKEFIYFTDLNNNASFEGSSCTGECLDSPITITKNNFIKELNIFGPGCLSAINDLDIVFKRPDSGALIYSTSPLLCAMEYAQIVVYSSGADPVHANIEIYPSGRIQIN